MKNFALIAVLTLNTVVTAADLHVPKQYPTIQGAIDAAVAGDFVLVHGGTYNEKIDLLGKAISVIGVDGPAATTIDATGLEGSVVVCMTDEGPKTIISGLTLTGGIGTIHPVWGVLQGGGVFAYYTSPTITNCVISGNQANFAAGAWLQESQSTMSNVLFENNSINYPNGGGGGLYLWNSSAVVTNCSFVNNHSLGAGGGLRCKSPQTGGASVIQNCSFTSNTAATFGGGTATTLASPIFEQCTFTDNRAVTFGGAASIGSQPATFRNCSFELNDAGVHGGALRVNETGTVVEKCEFNSNTSDSGGGAVLVAGGSFSATCSISGSAFRDNYGGGLDGAAILHLDIATSDIDSSMFCGNLPTPIAGAWNDLGGNIMNGSCSFLCMGDIDANGTVSVSDILRLIADFGQCNGIDSCFSDLNEDEQVNVSDLLILISNWGICQ